jgi:hypothetical protein
MQRYFFNVRDGVSHPDTIGAEFAVPGDARAAAVRFAADVLRDEVDALLRGEDWRLDLVDANGGVFFSVLVSTVGAEPAA